MSSEPPQYRPDGPILLCPHDPAWPAAFAEAASELASHLSDVLVALHHVGSTAIPGIAAKPVIDVLVVVADLDALDRHVNVVVALGYEALGEYGIPRRRYFRRNNPLGARTHQVHAFPRGHEQIERMLLFRDYLRATPDAARQYEMLKRDLAARCGTSIERYAESKTEFVEAILTRARARAGKPRAPALSPEREADINPSTGAS